jgi:protein-disulfide isomerase
VNGTPTFFVNGVRHNGGYDLPSLLAAVSTEL